MSDEKAWSENFGPFCLVGRKSDRFDQKVGDIRKSGRDDRFYRSSGKGLEFKALNLSHFWLDLRVVREDIWSGNMIIATTIQMLEQDKALFTGHRAVTEEEIYARKFLE